MRNHSAKSLLIVSALIFFCAGLTFAQAKSCAVTMQIVSDDVEGPVTGATATAVNTVTEKSYKSVLKKGKPHFAGLATGDYRVTVYKPKFKQSVQFLSLTCKDDLWHMPIYLGSFKEIAVVSFQGIDDSETPPRRIYTVSEDFFTARKNGEETENSKLPAGVFIGDRNISEKNEEPPPILKTLPPESEPKPLPEFVSLGVINGRATYLAKPEYPAAAKAVKASGAVNVMVTLDEEGNVLSAAAVSGHPLLRAPAVSAARLSKFKETVLSGQRVKVKAVIVYNFVP